MAWAKGRQERNWSFKDEFLKIHPDAVCKRRRYEQFRITYFIVSTSFKQYGRASSADEAWEKSLVMLAESGEFDWDAWMRK